MTETIKHRLKLSVGALIDFSARSGDLFAEMPLGPSSQEGIAGHQKIQKARDKSWQKEYRLKQILQLNEFEFTLQGRVDLLFDSQKSLIDQPAVIIEEIKTTYTTPDKIPREQKALHWAQAKVYAYLYYLEKQVSAEPIAQDSAIRIVISWLDLTTDTLHSQHQDFLASELTSFTLDLVHIYLDWQRDYIAHRRAVIESAKSLAFPYANYRQGQHNFARHVYQTVKDKNQLLIEAPTGTGKTISTLFPLIKAIGEKKIDQVVYLTAKGSAQDSARKTLDVLINQQLFIDVLSIQAKDKACPCRSNEQAIKTTCQDDSGKCSRTIGFFDRLPAARLACLQAKILDSKTLQTIAETYLLCPFELSLQMIRWSSVVICDFNYVLDPLVRLAIFDENKSRRALLIDEIHNLADRAKAMYSASLSADETKFIASQLSQFPALQKAVQGLARKLNRLTNETDQWLEQPKNIEKAISQLQEIIAASEINTSFGNDLSGNQPLGFTDWLKQIYRYRVISELYSDSHITLAVNENKTRGRKKTGKNVLLRLMCLDASLFLREKYQSARAMIGFSATLTPLDYSLQTLGYAENSRAFSLPAVFPPENQLTIRCDYIDSRWQHRDASIKPLGDLISSVYQQRPGKYLIFFPSYDYLNQCYNDFVARYPQYAIIQQNRASSDTERQAFLERFFSSDQPTIGFAILGGIFAEGVDFVGDALTGALIVGTGMPQPSIEQKLLERYYVEKGLNGFQFAYQFPGFTRVKQTAGRVIRSETDKGIVVLIDPRFRRNDYQSLMPAHWRISPAKNLFEVNELLEFFWGK